MKSQVKSAFFGLAPGPTAAVTGTGRTKPTGGKWNKNPNLYFELTPFEGQPDPPYDNTNHPYDDEWDGTKFIPSPWLTTGDQATLKAAWDMVTNETYGSIQMKTISSGTQGFFYIEDGIYMPAQDDAGRVVNTVDWSDKYDAVRGYYWLYWTDAGSSCGIIFNIGERPTSGSVNFGSISIEQMRSYSYSPSIAYYDGNGGSGRAYMGTAQATNSDTSCVQFEFVKGSHIKLELYQIQNGTLNFANCIDPPDWNFDTPANVATVDMSGAGYNQIVPNSPSHFAQLGGAGTVGRYGKIAWECRPIGGKWKYLK